MTTTDHDQIRRWAEERGGKPTTVKGTGRGKGDVGMIRIDFPGYSGGGKLAPIPWEEWFEKFDRAGLAMVLQEETAGGEQSHFNRLVSRESVETDGGKGARAGKASPGRRGARAGKASSSGSQGARAGKAAAAGKANGARKPAARATSRARSAGSGAAARKGASKQR